MNSKDITGPHGEMRYFRNLKVGEILAIHTDLEL